jgi:hypothetical protein
LATAAKRGSTLRRAQQRSGAVWWSKPCSCSCSARQEINEVEIPLGGDAVAVLVGLGEVVAGVEKEDRNVGA